MNRRFNALFLQVVLPCVFLVFCYEHSVGQNMRRDDSTRFVARMVKNSGHILWVAPRPGSEDVRTLSYLRSVRGFKVSLLFLTNGESLPVLGEEWSTRTISSQRKEEALQFGNRFGQVRFLNRVDRPDDGSPWSDEDILNAAMIIRELRPTMIVIGSDHQWQIDRPECLRAMRNGMEAAVLLAGDPAFQPAGPKYLRSPWIPETRVVGRVNGLGWRPQADENANALINEWQNAYPSIAWQTGVSGSGAYYREAGEKGLVGREVWVEPHVRTLRLKSTERFVHTACDAVLSKRKDALQQISSSLDSISAIFREGTDGLSPWDQRILVQWKGGLDRIKLLLLGHDVRIEISEQILTDRQVAFVVVTGVHELAKKGNAQLMFQLEEGDSWIIQETTRRLFALKGDSIMTIISPAKNDYAYPIESFGLSLPSLRFPLRVSILYDAAGVRKNSFIETQEASVGFAPRHAGVILNPDVHVESNEPLVVRSWNYSRDPVFGSYFVSDSNCTGRSNTFRTEGKNSSRDDSVWVDWKNPGQGSTATSELMSGKKVVDAFRGHSFSVNMPRSLRVGVIGTPHRAIERAVRRLPLSIPPVLFSSRTLQVVESLDVVVVDAEYRPTGVLVRSLTSWIAKGGRILVLNASNLSALWKAETDSLWATAVPAVSNRESLIFHSEAILQDSLRPADRLFTSWPVPRARQKLSWSSGISPEVVVEDSSGVPMAVRMRVGKGDLFVSTLNMSPALQSLNDQAHELLAFFLGTK